MEIILVKPIKNLGKIGEVVKVKDGYARNYLIPLKLAVKATANNKLLFEKKKIEYEERNKLAKIEAENTAQSIKEKDLIFIRHASDDGKLFGSVSSKEIISYIKSITSCNISHIEVLIKHPIKTIGVFLIDIVLHAEVIISINIVVAKSELEALDHLKIHKSLVNS